MVYVFGVGEVPISVSGALDRPAPLVLTVRSVGAVTKALCAAEPGAVLGVREPFGTGWRRPRAATSSSSPAGSGLAPLRPVLLQALERAAYGEVVLLYGAHAARLALRRRLERWRSDATVDVTVDAASPDWRGRVGVVPQLVPGAASTRTRRRLSSAARDHVALRRAGPPRPGRRGPSGSTTRWAERTLRRRPLRPLPARADVCRDSPVYDHATAAPWLEVRAVSAKPSSPSGSSPRATAASSPCSTARTAARDRRRGGDRLLPRGVSAEVEAVRPLDRGNGDDAARRGADPGAPHARRRSSRSAPCATAGGIQALRNFADVEDFTRLVYASPEFVSTLCATSTPISAHVPVDFELRGNVDKRQLLEVITAFLPDGGPGSSTSVCTECKRRGTVCVVVAHGTPCLG